MSAEWLLEAERPDRGRVIALFDVNCFYAQCEELKDSRLCGKPVGVYQKHLMVTSNYLARSMGVEKFMSAAQAKKACPSLVLVNGEDLTPYRAASRALAAVLCRYGPSERQGLDEAYVDITDDARAVCSERGVLAFEGHVLGGEVGVDRGPSADARGRTADDGLTAAGDSDRLDYLRLLAAGSLIAQDIRAAVLAETGLRVSGGVGANRLSAKVAANAHKPDALSVLLPHAARGFLASLPLRALPGLGRGTERAMAPLCLQTVGDLQNVPLDDLQRLLGLPRAKAAYLAARGKASARVIPEGPPRSLGVEEGLRACTGWAALGQELAKLASELARRLAEDRVELGRRPVTLTLRWALRGAAGERPRKSSASVPAPRACTAAQLAEAATTALSRALPSSFHLSMLGMSVARFEPASRAWAGREGWGREASADATTPGALPGSAASRTRREEREAREARGGGRPTTGSSKRSRPRGRACEGWEGLGEDEGSCDASSASTSGSWAEGEADTDEDSSWAADGPTSAAWRATARGGSDAAGASGRRVGATVSRAAEGIVRGLVRRPAPRVAAPLCTPGATWVRDSRPHGALAEAAVVPASPANAAEAVSALRSLCARLASVAPERGAPARIVLGWVEADKMGAGANGGGDRKVTRIGGVFPTGDISEDVAATLHRQALRILLGRISTSSPARIERIAIGWKAWV